MKVYKGTNKNLQCLGYQFTLGKTEEIEGKIKLCERGFHACESPLDVFSYYPPTDGRYFEAELDGVTDEHGNDSKRVGRKITLGAEIGIPGLVKAHVEYVNEHINRKKTEKSTGDLSAATNTGDQSAATSTGYRSAATSTGYQSAATSTGDRSAATVETGGSVAICTGKDGKARAGIGSAIVLCERDDDYNLIAIQAVIIDGEKYRPNTWYTLKEGKVVIAL